MVDSLKDYTLPTSTWQVQYNGFDFNIVSDVHYNMTMVYDEADRTKTYELYKIEVHGGFWQDTATDMNTSNQTLIQALSAPGGELIIKGVGLDLHVAPMNSTSYRHDLKWGPKPRTIKFDQVAGGIAYEIIWQCEVAILDCANSYSLGRGNTGPNYKGIMAFNTTITYSIDKRGLTTRAITGYYEIPLTRTNGPTSTDVPYTADFFRNQVNIAVPNYMVREKNEWRESADKRRMDFQILDHDLETDDPLPPGIVEGEMDISIENMMPMNFIEWNHTISCTFQRLAGTGRDWAYRQFWLILAQYATNLQSTSNIIAGSTAGTAMAIPLKIRVTDNKYTRISSFFCQFHIIQDTKNIMAMTGMWQPVPGSNYNLWRASMQAAWSNRGLAQIGTDASQEVIIDLCKPANMTAGSTAGNVPFSYSSQSLFGCDGVTEDNSLIRFDNDFAVKEDGGVVVHYPSQGQVPPDQASVQWDDSGTTVTPNSSSAKSPISQYRRATKTTIVMKGCALRVKYEPVVPVLKTWNGVKVVQKKRKVTGPKRYGSLAECPILQTCWEIEYELTQIPPNNTTMKAAPDPYLDDGDQNSLDS